MAISISESPLPDVASTETITVRGVILGVLSIAGMSLYITHYGGALIKSYLPVAIMVPFLMWVIGNCILKMVMPSLALTRVELLTILSISEHAARSQKNPENIEFSTRLSNAFLTNLECLRRLQRSSCRGR